MYDDQEKIKLRELIPHKGLVPEAIPSKLFLDMVPSYSTDVTGSLYGHFFYGGFVYVLFTKQTRKRL